MPSGIAHARASLVLAAPAFGLAFSTTQDAVFALAAAGGVLAGIALTPDLDQQTRSFSESSLIKFSLGVGALWIVFWYPYALLIPHRSPLSHWPILGTLGRLAYIGIFAWLLIWAFGWRVPPVPSWAGWALFGLALSDFAHWLMDVWPKPRFLKRRR